MFLNLHFYTKELDLPDCYAHEILACASFKICLCVSKVMTHLRSFPRGCNDATSPDQSDANNFIWLRTFVVNLENSPEAPQLKILCVFGSRLFLGRHNQRKTEQVNAFVSTFSNSSHLCSVTCVYSSWTGGFLMPSI